MVAHLPAKFAQAGMSFAFDEVFITPTLYPGPLLRSPRKDLAISTR